jgi:hypothetical protein
MTHQHANLLWRCLTSASGRVSLFDFSNFSWLILLVGLCPFFSFGFSDFCHHVQMVFLLDVGHTAIWGP